MQSQNSWAEFNETFSFNLRKPAHEIYCKQTMSTINLNLKTTMNAQDIVKIFSFIYSQLLKMSLNF